MGIIKTEAVVLKQFDLGEADKIITFYTKDYGKVRAVAKGVRKSRSSMSGIVLPFTYNYMTFYQGNSLDRINQVKNIFSFSKLREDLTKMAYASFVAELIEKVGLENDPNQALFSLLLSTLHQLLKTEVDELKYIELAYKVRILAILGIKPELEHCISCNKEMNYGRSNIFNIEYGGLLCRKCLEENSSKYAAGKFILLGEAVQVIKNLFNSGLKPIANLKISLQAYQQLDELVNKFITYHLDLKLRSFDFLNMIKNLG
jgi:DNA repair protein RecO (recombination protein O)